MNLPSEQINPNLNIDIADDDPLTRKAMRDTIIYHLGKENCSFEMICKRKVLVYNSTIGKKIVLLYKACTYLGGNGQHPSFKKRIQLPDYYKDIYNNLPGNYDLRFIGVYHYKGLIVYVDFIKDTYLKKKMHNSAAHVYINDLYQAIKNDVFDKIDRNGNHIYTIKFNYLKKYLDNVEILSPTKDLISLFKEFNNGFDFGTWIKAVFAIQEMKEKHWSKWRETEWAGWFLEYKYNNFVIKNHYENQMRYLGTTPKEKKEFDFDIYFGENKFYGDLKASDIVKKIAPGNDCNNLVNCINKYGVFWYVIYEHETISDKNCNGEAEAERKRLILEDEPDYYSKHKKGVNSDKHRFIKNSVKFEKMMIIEINKINFHTVLTKVNQGRQPTGGDRNPKFNINKSNIDNYVVYRYIHKAGLNEKRI